MKTFPDHAIQEILDIFLKYSGPENPNLSPDLETRLEMEAMNLESLLSSLQQHVRDRVSNIRSRRNNLIPVYRLPPEVLALIFLEVQGYQPRNEQAYLQIKTLAAVSAKWSSCIFSTPQLWTQVGDTYHPCLVKSIIQRSKSLPLHLSLGHSSSKDVLELLRPHANRWKAVEIVGLKIKLLDDDNMQGITLSQLESFHVLGKSSDLVKRVEVPEVIRCRAPRLHDLSLGRLPLPLEAPVSVTLREVSFNPVHGDIELSSHQWQTFLSASPQLESLYASRRHARVRRGEHFPLFHVSLPHLHKITLKNLSASVTGGLISSICPGLKESPYLTIWHPHKNQGESVFDTLFRSPRQPHSLSQMIREMKWMFVQMFYNGVILIKAGRISGKPFLTVWSNFLPDEREMVMKNLADMADNQILESLYLSDPSLFEGSMVAQGLSWFPGVKKLTLIHSNLHTEEPNYHDNLADICERLSLPFIREDGVDNGWLLPCLTHLVIAGSSEFGAVRPLVEARCSSHQSSRMENRPAKLEVLQLTSMTWEDRESPASVSSVLERELHELLGGHGTELRINWPVEEDIIAQRHRVIR